jgi:hypothetical protein
MSQNSIRLKGTVHNIHKEDNLWCFKYEKEKQTFRVPFVFYSGKYEDGEELDCYIETLAGIDRAKPLFERPTAN